MPLPKEPKYSPEVEAYVESVSHALCIAEGIDPDKMIYFNNPTRSVKRWELKRHAAIFAIQILRPELLPSIISKDIQISGYDHLFEILVGLDNNATINHDNFNKCVLYYVSLKANNVPCPNTLSIVGHWVGFNWTKDLSDDDHRKMVVFHDQGNPNPRPYDRTREVCVTMD